MRYVVIGAGAIGGTIGARLAEAGRDVVLVARGAHLDALRESGLTLDEPGRSRTLRLPAAGGVDEIGWQDGDVALLCTKTQDTVVLLDALRAVAPAVPVVCAQNGVANERFAADRFASVQAMCVVLPAEHLTPGRVVAYSTPVPGILDIGRCPEGVDAVTEVVAADLTAAGFSARTDPAIMRAKYRKLLLNLGNAAEAACGPDDPDLRELADLARAEGERCLAAAGIDVQSREEERTRRGGFITEEPVDGAARQGGSTWQSLRRGAGSVEAEYLNGEIVALGRAHEVPTPVNALLLDTVAEMAASTEAPGSRKAQGLLATVG
ncbi:ketopantoate reductase family protein [Pseudonocardia sp. MH-G8]|uniref:ketopantoate reductase family protein n=1 Tax=Pseudonocardia sp. MH-G8 TaxID=1854588 RepID=UPI000B9FEDC7|nr:2-dehydropantoate 2-reductase N-terminal domain-containing protein [Pseudonocardia sp. MH-G8]OZM79559.1 2-dehydropantoate 2-reductase [Pseudonocardia sp. MH-G8]